MDWSTLSRIDPTGLTGKMVRNAEVINRNIADLMTYRNLAGAGAVIPPKSSGPGNAVDEALRRELILRNDILRLETAAKRDTSENAAAMKAVRDLLTERGTHTHSIAS